MGKVADLNRRIKSKLHELAEDQKDKERAHRIIRNIEARVNDLRTELAKVRRRIAHRRAVIEAIQEDLEKLDEKSPGEDTQEELELKHNLDQLAGELEEDIATRDRILDKLDQMQDRREDARQVLKHAIDESKEDREALQRMREKRRRIQEAREKNDRPSPNFDWAEFDCNDGTPIPEAAKPAIKHLCLTVLEPMREKYGDVVINSGYRTESWNRRVGGEPNSVHRYDEHPKAVAADCRCARGTPRDWFTFSAGKADGRGLYPTFVHHDNRNRIGWSDAVWYG